MTPFKNTVLIWCASHILLPAALDYKFPLVRRAKTMQGIDKAVSYLLEAKIQYVQTLSMLNKFDKKSSVPKEDRAQKIITT